MLVSTKDGGRYLVQHTILWSIMVDGGPSSLETFEDRDVWPRTSPEKGLEDICQDDLQNVMTTRQVQ
jgi:hypothetical protein